MLERRVTWMNTDGQAQIVQKESLASDLDETPGRPPIDTTMSLNAYDYYQSHAIGRCAALDVLRVHRKMGKKVTLVAGTRVYQYW